MRTSTETITGWALGVLGLAAVVALASGCRLPFGGESVTVEAENPALAAAFDRVRDTRGTARLGDVVTDSAIGIGAWDRMYSFYSPVSEDKVNATLGTEDLEWKGLPQDSDSAIQVFVLAGKVVYAFDDKVPRHSVHAKKYATPDSVVRARETRQDGPLSSGPVWVLDIEEFS
ncbi:hypothetical protein IU450_27665 [Nocardia abscessus]|uniref:hypothetical protein n=1 Tax=Nocardia abscessus TaxID=120957 RepID=UPI001892E244|nr:hypothetical protein [Nocardia abscessus]MBF6339647.1 hypothetical protein [Nocardia abscessus]